MSLLKILLISFCILIIISLSIGLWLTRKEKIDRISHRLYLSFTIGIEVLVDIFCGWLIDGFIK